MRVGCPTTPPPAKSSRSRMQHARTHGHARDDISSSLARPRQTYHREAPVVDLVVRESATLAPPPRRRTVTVRTAPEKTTPPRIAGSGHQPIARATTVVAVTSSVSRSLGSPRGRHRFAVQYATGHQNIGTSLQSTTTAAAVKRAPSSAVTPRPCPRLLHSHTSQASAAAVITDSVIRSS